MPVMPRIYVETFGCQMNEADSNEIVERASDAGYAVATRAEEADVVVLNTCTVRDNAERRAYGRMNHLKVLKDRDPGVRLVVSGCLAEQDRDRMQRIAPHVDAIFGTKELAQLGESLSRWRPEFEDLDRVDDRTLAGDEFIVQPLGGKADGIASAFSNLRAFVTVQRGCSYYCTFCIVPYVRGRFDHRSLDEIQNDVEERVKAGAREVLLVGQTVNAWRDASGRDFGSLLKTICHPDPASCHPERVEFISPHPKDFTEAMIATFAELDALNPRIHLPLQSGSNAVLRRMNRKYTVEAFEERLSWIHRYLPHWAVTTDIIVGFPGETEGDFAQTLRLVETGVFANAFTFIYSPRRGTPAARWEQLDRDVVAERFRRLVEAQNRATLAHHECKVGSISRCLISGPSKYDAGKLAAKTPDNVTVVAPKPADYDDPLYAREPWLDVAIESAYLWGCTGRVVRRAKWFKDEGTNVPPESLDLIGLTYA